MMALSSSRLAPPRRLSPEWPVDNVAGRRETRRILWPRPFLGQPDRDELMGRYRTPGQAGRNGWKNVERRETKPWSVINLVCVPTRAIFSAFFSR